MIPTLFIVFLVTCLTAAAVNLSNEDSQTIIVPDQNESAFSPHVNRTILSHLVFGINDRGEKAYDSLPEMLESMKPFEDLPRVLMVGITGAGKSLAIAKLLGFPLKWICGKITGCGYNIDYARLNELKEKETTNYPLSAPPEIGTSGFSKTLYSTFHQDDDFVWVDTPGFLGNRGSEVDVMEDISRELVIRSSKKIQAIGIVVEYASLDRGGDLNFAEVLNRVTEWLPDSKIRDSLLFFVLTKVPQEMNDEENLDNFIEQKIQVYKKNADDLYKKMIPYLKNNDTQSLKAIEELQNQFTLFRDGVELLNLMAKRKVVLNPRENDLAKLRREVESCIFGDWPNRHINEIDGSKRAGIFRFIYANASKKAEYPKYLQDIAITGRKVMYDLSNTKNLADSLNQTLHILESTGRLSAIDKTKSMENEIERLNKQTRDLRANITTYEKKIRILKTDLTPVPLDPVQRQFQSYYSILPNSFNEFAKLLNLGGQVLALFLTLYTMFSNRELTYQQFWDSVGLIQGIGEASKELKEAFDKSRTVTINYIYTGPLPLNDVKPYHWEVYEVNGNQNLPATEVTTTYEFDKVAKKLTLHCLPPFHPMFFQKSYVASVTLFIDKKHAKSTQDEITGLQDQIDQLNEEIEQYQDQINDFNTTLTLHNTLEKINQDIQETKERLQSVKRSYRKLKSKWERLKDLFQVLFQSEALLDLLPEDLYVIQLFKQEYEDYINSLKPTLDTSKLHSEL